jgi:hypothetical protein
MNNVERNGCALGVSRGNITMILEVANLNIRPGESADFEHAFAEAQAISAARAVSTNRQRINGCGPSTDIKTSQVLIERQGVTDYRSS